MNVDIESLRLNGIALAALTKRTKPPQATKRQPFLKGPIPLDWIEAAVRLPGATWSVATVLWYSAGLTKSRTVRVSYVAASRMGLTRNTVRRGLARLAAAGLISVKRKPGCSPIVTLLDCCEHGGAGDDRRDL